MDLLQVLNHERALISSDKSFLTSEEEEKIAKELELATLENVAEQPRNYIVVERCDISTLKE